MDDGDILCEFERQIWQCPNWGTSPDGAGSQVCIEHLVNGEQAFNQSSDDSDDA